MNRNNRLLIVFAGLIALLLSAKSLAAEPVLVDAEWLAGRLDDPQIVIVDMSADPYQYRRFHLPNARYLPPAALVRKNERGVKVRVTDRQLYGLLGRLGVTADSHVVIYDNMGGLEAGRLFWELEHVGHARVSVLDGGLVKWIREKRPVTFDTPSWQRTHYRGRGEGRPNQIDLEGVVAAAAEPSVILLDVRTPEEYRGIPTDPETGHIPGARLWPWEQAVDFERGFTLKDATSLGEGLAGAGIERSDSNIVLYCRTGHRAAQTYLTLRHLGFERVRLYEASMAEFARARPRDVRRSTVP